MSIAGLRWTRAAIRTHGHAMTPTEKLLLRHLGDIVRDDGTWAETKADLRADLVIGENTLDRAVQGLGKLGLLRAEARWQGKRRLANAWCLPLDVPQTGGHPLPQNGGGSPPRNGGPSFTNPTSSVPSEPPTAAPPAAGPAAQGDPMHQPDDAQLGFDLGVEAPEPAPKPRKDGGPVQRVVAAYCAAYVAEHGRQPASERGRVAGQVKTLIGQGHTEAELTEAADQLGHTRFTYLAEQVRMVRAQTRRVQTAAVGGVEGWQGTGTDGPATGSGPSALDRVYG